MHLFFAILTFKKHPNSKIELFKKIVKSQSVVARAHQYEKGLDPGSTFLEEPKLWLDTYLFFNVHHDPFIELNLSIILDRHKK